MLLPLVLAGCVLGGCSCRDSSRTASEQASVPTEQASVPTEAPTRSLRGLSSEQAQQVLARIDHRELTVLDFADELSMIPAPARARFVMPAHRAELLERIVRDELLADEARRRGYDVEPDVVRARRRALVRLLAGEIREEVLAGPEPTEADLFARWSADQARWSNPELGYLRYIRLQNEALARRVLASLLRSEPRKLPRDFQRAAERYAPAGFADTTGDLGPFARPEEQRPEDADVPEPLARAAFASAAGTLHPEIVAHDGAYYIVWPQAVVPETRVSFEQARPILVAELREKAVAARLERLATEDRAFTIDDELLARVADPFEQ